MKRQFIKLEIEMPDIMRSDLTALAERCGYQETEEVILEGLAWLLMNREAFLKNQYPRIVKRNSRPE